MIGLNCEEILVHLFNHLWPNIFEIVPHFIQAFQLTLEGFRISLGPDTLLLHLIQGLFHPSSFVRSVYWRLYNNLYIG